MIFALLFASVEPPDDVSMPGERYAESPAGRREREGAKAAIVRDQELVERLNGDDEIEAQQAFGRIMHLYSDRLIRFAYGFSGSADGAEDMVQDVFIRVWERRNSIRSDESLRAYLFTAVRRAGLDLLKHKAVETRHAASIGYAEGEPHLLNVDEELDADVIAQQVRAAIARLTERRQTALRLRYEEQLPFAVVAEVMELSEKSVKHLVGRAVKEVRGYLGL